MRVGVSVCVKLNLVSTGIGLLQQLDPATYHYGRADEQKYVPCVGPGMAMLIPCRPVALPSCCVVTHLSKHSVLCATDTVLACACILSLAGPALKSIAWCNNCDCEFETLIFVI